MARIATTTATPILIDRRPVRSGERELVDRLHQRVNELTEFLQSQRQVIEALEESNRHIRLQFDAMRRSLAVHEQRTQHLQDDLVAELIGGDCSTPDVLLRRADRLGIDLRTPRAVLLISADSAAELSIRRGGGASGIELAGELRLIVEQACQHEAPGTVVSVKSHDLVVLAASKPDGVDRYAHLRSLASILRDEVRNSLRGLTVSIGIGSVCETLQEYAKSYQRARWAVDGTRARGERDVTIASNQQGIHALIFDLQDQDRLLSIIEDAIGTLLDYDRCHATDFTQTLDLYLRNDCCLQPTAAAAHLHISSLRYRLRRIEEITGANLHCAETKFNLQFALRMLQILKPDSARETASAR